MLNDAERIKDNNFAVVTINLVNEFSEKTKFANNV